MHGFLIHLTEQQKTFLKKRMEKTKIPMAVQIREAIDEYIKKYEGGKIESDNG